MLVLSRKQLERIVIGSDIWITVVKLEGNQVRLGIDAPTDLPVLRAELLGRLPEPEGHPLGVAPTHHSVRPKG